MRQRFAERLGMVLAAVCLIAACTAKPELEPKYRLAERFSEAEVFHEPGVVEFSGTESGVLLEGWSWTETGSQGADYQWSNRPKSTVAFFLSRPRDLALELRCYPLPEPGRPRQAIEVVINGRPIERLDLETGWKDYFVSVPASATKTGMNRIDFRYAWIAVPADSAERRRLAVAWDRLQILPNDPNPPQVDPERELIVLPTGSRMDFYLDLPSASRLSLPAVSVRGSAGLLVTLASDFLGPDERPVVASISATGRDHEYSLDGFEGPARLRFEVSASAAAVAPENGAGGVVIERPTILAEPGRAKRVPESGGAVPAALEEIRSRRPNVVLYLIDALRKDRLGAYGYSRPVSPRFDRLAARGVLFEDAHAQAPWTKPSVASIFTGLLPWRHGASGAHDALASGTPNLAAILQAAGYQTGAVSSNGYVSRAFGFDRGFDDFVQLRKRTTRSQEVHAEALDWLARTDSRPFFLYVHTIDPHAPYDPPEDLRQRFAPGVRDPELGSIERMKERLKSAQPPSLEELRDLLQLYDAEIAANDRELGRFLDEVASRDRYRDTLVIVTSDHGEEFYDHGGWTHRLSLHSEVIEVPLVMRFPRDWSAGRRVSTVAQHADLLPTILDVLGLPIPDGVDGDSLLGWITDDAELPGRPAVSHLGIAHGPLFGVALGDWKLITSRPAGRLQPPELYRRSEDPGELHNVASEYPVTVGYLTARLRSQLAARELTTDSEAVELDDETRRNLEALGYLD